VYGKIFEQLFSGSMYGAGPTVFAVWSFVIATGRIAEDGVTGTVEINPKLLANILGTDQMDVESSVQFLCRPDPDSRSKKDEGRRLVKEGQFLYRVPTLADYRAIRSDDERRQYNREAKRKQRTKHQQDVNDSQ
jgi:hypothetical protein